MKMKAIIVGILLLVLGISLVAEQTTSGLVLGFILNTIGINLIFPRGEFEKFLEEEN